ncbi:hypothetical protein J6590_052365 [Homalodisca vitripennis]|nr:hypothetical protein J6590_052365 [Homalodisca vitripennis]
MVLTSLGNLVIVIVSNIYTRIGTVRGKGTTDCHIDSGRSQKVPTTYVSGGEVRGTVPRATDRHHARRSCPIPGPSLQTSQPPICSEYRLTSAPGPERDESAAPRPPGPTPATIAISDRCGSEAVRVRLLKHCRCSAAYNLDFNELVPGRRLAKRHSARTFAAVVLDYCFDLITV